MVGTRQSYLHGGESDIDGCEGLEQCAYKLEEDRQEVDKPVWEVVLGCIVPKANKEAGHDRPERHRFVVGDEICLGKCENINIPQMLLISTDERKGEKIGKL